MKIYEKKLVFTPDKFRSCGLRVMSHNHPQIGPAFEGVSKR